jgi:NAD(P)-dependent dehydrogenase (short-subunit alcohol dehydrogenase family)
MDTIKSNRSRVVIVSSKLHEKGAIKFENFGKLEEIEEGKKTKKNDTYSNSKLMNFYFAKELYQRGIDCHVLCPGLCYTNLFRDFKAKFYHYILFSPIILFFMRSAKQGAQNILYAALDNVNDLEKNPSKSYIIMNLKQTKSKITLNDDVSTRLWKESEKLCGLRV